MDHMATSHAHSSEAATVSAILQAAQEYESGLVGSSGQMPQGITGTIHNAGHTQDPATQGFANAPLEEMVEIRLQFTNDEQVAVPPAVPTPPVHYNIPSVTTTVDSETQSLSWNELSLEMLADIVSQQVIQVSQLDEVPTATTGHGKCRHMAGIKWKELLDMIINAHNATCMRQTGVMFSHNTVKVGVTLEASGLDIGLKTIYTGENKVSIGVQTASAERKEVEIQTLPFEKDETSSMQDTDNKTKNNDTSSNLVHTGARSDVDVANISVNDSVNKEVPVPVSVRKSKWLSKKEDNEEEMDEDDGRDDPDWSPDYEDEEETGGINQSNHQSPRNHIPNQCDQLTAHSASDNSELSIETSQSDSSEVESENIAKVEQKLFTNQEEIDDDAPVKGYPAKCTVCSKRFKSRTLLKRHMIVHEPNRNQHPCKFCDKVCKTLCYLERHMAAHFKPKPPPGRKRVTRQQGRCKQQQKRKAQPQKRMPREKLPTTCKACGKIFTIARNLTRHEKIHERKTHFPCEHCNKVCKSAHYLQLHMMIHANEKQHKCNECNESFGQKYKLKQHLAKAHNKYEQHQCEVCGMVYKNKETLDDHMLQHTNKKSYLCELCGKTFTRPAVYRLHQAYHTARADPNAHKCHLCSKSYHSQGLLNKHVRSTHKGERNHKCRVCETGFFTKQQQLSHEQVHREKTTHVCTFCNKGFAQKHTLLVHRRMHLGERPYKCKYCSKAFTSKNFLVKHEKIHTSQGEQVKRTFQCRECTSTFASKTAWSDHEKRHKGIKEHKCEFCFVAFVTRGDLVRHLRTHTGGRPFKCKQCDKSFARKIELTEHEAQHWSVQVPITVTLLPAEKQTSNNSTLPGTN